MRLIFHIFSSNVLILFILYSSDSVYGQGLPNTTNYIVKKFNSTDGLFNNTVSGFVFDNQGLGWLGSADGIHFFDGKHIYKLNNYLGTHNPILDNQVKKIFYDNKANILLVFCFDNIKTTIYTIHLKTLAEKIISNTLKVLIEFPGDVSYVSSAIYNSNELFCIIGKKIYSFEIDNFKIKNISTRFAVGSKLLYMENEGVFLGDYINQQIFKVRKQNGELKLDFIRKANLTELDNLFEYKGIACNTCKDIKNSSLVKLREYEPIIASAGLSEEFYLAKGITHDKFGNIYLFGGLGFQKITIEKQYIFPMPIKGAETRSIFFSDNENKGLVATSKGVFPFELDSPQISYKLLINNRNLAHYYNTLIKKGKDTIVFFPQYPKSHPKIHQSVLFYNLTTKAVTKEVANKTLKIDPNEPQLELQSTFQDSNGTIYVGTNKSLCIAQFSKDSVYLLPTGIRNNETINCIMPSYEKGHLILGTIMGLYDVELNTKKTKLLYNGEILSLLRYSDGWIAGTRRFGALFFNKSNKLFNKIDTKAGLLNNTIYTMLYDSHYHITWFGTGGGLFAYHNPTGKIKTYTIQDKIVDEEFNRNSSLMLSGDSLILMGGIKGLTAIRNREPFYRDVRNVKLLAWGVEAFFENNHEQLQLINPIKELSFSEKVRKIKIRIASYASQNQQYFIAYKVDDNGWNYLKMDEDIELIGIKPGSHTVFIKALSAEMKESSLTKINLKIEQAWYKSLLGSFIFLFLGILIMLPVMYLRSKYVRLEADVKINENRERLFSIIAHDLRSPLKTYQGMGEVIDYLIEKEDWKRLKLIGREIDITSYKLDIMVKNLLNWSLLQQKKIKPVLQTVNFSNIIEELLPIYKILAKNKDIELIENIQFSDPINTDVNLLSLIIRNMLDNAIKNTPPFRKISFVAKKTNSKIILIFENDFDEHNRDFLISLSKNIKQLGWSYSGGLGLGFVNQAIKLLKGKKEVNVDTTQNTIIWSVELGL